MNLPFALTITNLLAAFLAALFYKKIDKKVHPFLWYLFLAAIAELSFFITKQDKTKIAIHLVGNIYYLIETLLYLTFFYSVNVIKNLRWYAGLTTFTITLFFASWLFKNPLTYYVMIPYQIVSVLIIVLSVNLITQQIWQLKTNLIKNGLFLIGAGILLVTTNSFFIEAIFLLGIGDKNFENNIFYIYRFVNLSVFLIDIAAILCLTKQKI